MITYPFCLAISNKLPLFLGRPISPHIALKCFICCPLNTESISSGIVLIASGQVLMSNMHASKHSTDKIYDFFCLAISSNLSPQKVVNNQANALFNF